MKKIRRDVPGILAAGFFTFFVLFVWFWMFYVTQPATESNTYKTRGMIEAIEIDFASYRGSDKLYLFFQDRCYMLDTRWVNKEKTNELATSILSGENFTATIWKHLPRDMREIQENGVYVYQVIDLRNSQNIYLDIATHNACQKTERIFGIVISILLSISATLVDFIIYSGLPSGIGKRKKKRKK